ncbi:MBL fold metallo-hydrolase [soil metagenome]
MPDASLSYLQNVPERGQSVEVAPGVRWIRLPLPYRLDHINVWSIEDGDGWALVDTGVYTPETEAAWDGLMSRPPLNWPLKRVIVTHMHPDHIGMSGLLTRKFHVGLWISRLEYLSCRATLSEEVHEPTPGAIGFYRAAGWSPAALEVYRQRFGEDLVEIHALPDSFRRLEDSQMLRIGSHDWEVIGGNGHSPEHSSLYCRDLKLFISGDQVLPKISSNVSVHPVEPEANPMLDWLQSLDAIEARVSEDVLVLPAHNDCFRGLHLRIAQLRSGQQKVMTRLLDHLDEPRRVVDAFVPLFKRAIPESDATLFQLATGEAIANLNYLISRGEVTKRLEGGVAWYQRT